MPRVSEDHAAMRQQQILDAALRCFAREGFHATSMSDVIKESGLSAGAVYTYYASKTDLISAAAASALSRAQDALHWAIEADEPVPPLRVVEVLLERVGSAPQEGVIDGARLGVTVWAEALRDPAVLEIVASTYRSLRQDMLVVLRRWRDAGGMRPDADLDAAARAMFGAIPGFVIQRLMLSDVTPGQFVSGMALLGLQD